MLKVYFLATMLSRALYSGLHALKSTLAGFVKADKSQGALKDIVF